MDSINDILETFTEEDIRNFRGFVTRHKRNDDRKDLQLLELYLSKGVEAKKDFSQLLYPTGNNVAYQALRKRLIKMLNRFVALQLMDSDSSHTSEALALVNMARYLLAHNKDHLAWKYLKKAEKLCIQNSLFEILNSVYVLQIQNLKSENQVEHQELIALWNENKEKLRKNELGEIALSVISQKVLSARRSNKSFDFAKAVDEVLAELDIPTDYLSEPRFAYALAATNRKKMLSEKDYFNLAPFLVERYTAINQRQGFAKGNGYYKIGFLYMLGHVFFRRRLFSKATSYNDLLQAELAKAPKLQVNEFGPKSDLLKGAILVYTGNTQKAVVWFEQMLKANSRMPWKHRLMTITNLGIAYFHQGEYDQTHKTLQLITHTDQWCEKMMGTEWVVKKAMMEAILYFELEEFSLVDSRIKYIQRSFNDFLQQPQYQRIATFLRVMQKLSHLSSNDDMVKMKNVVEQAFEWLPTEFEDLQAMAFYAWLKGKLEGRDTYTAMIELVQA